MTSMQDDPTHGVPWKPSQDAWFSGFTDGEGAFVIGEIRATGFHPRLVINQRLDDLQVLEALQREFGGSIVIESSERAKKYGRHPLARWHVNSKRDLAGLLTYFDAFPLRAKKARDYTIWREAVQVYIAGGWRAPALRSLHAALLAGRAFAAPSQPTVVSDAQLRLPEDQ